MLFNKRTTIGILELPKTTFVLADMFSCLYLDLVSVVKRVIVVSFCTFSVNVFKIQRSAQSIDHGYFRILKIK